jgi:hypothetical protein
MFELRELLNIQLLLTHRGYIKNAHHFTIKTCFKEEYQAVIVGNIFELYKLKNGDTR